MQHPDDQSTFIWKMEMVVIRGAIGINFSNILWLKSIGQNYFPYISRFKTNLTD